MKQNIVSIGGVEVCNKKRIVFIAGPCILNTISEAKKIAKACIELSDKYSISYIFKGSYDKANRSSIHSFRGPGLEKGLDILNEIKTRFNIPVTTDVHNHYDIEKVAKVVDILQIPAFLSRQTDLITEAAKTKKIVNIKKGQFLAPGDMKNVVDKIIALGNRNILLTERGTSFGYNNLVVDMKGLKKMKQTGYPLIFDATHSVQLPGAKGKSSGGERQYIAALAKAATAIGVAGIFMEVHPDPLKSLSDSSTIYPLEKLDKLLNIITKIDSLIKNEK